jgi:hypothetical protein
VTDQPVPDPNEPWRPPPGTPVCVDPRDLVGALTADQVPPLLPKEIAGALLRTQRRR